MCVCANLPLINEHNHFTNTKFTSPINQILISTLYQGCVRGKSSHSGWRLKPFSSDATFSCDPLHKRRRHGRQIEPLTYQVNDFENVFRSLFILEPYCLNSQFSELCRGKKIQLSYPSHSLDISSESWIREHFSITLPRRSAMLIRALIRKNWIWRQVAIIPKMPLKENEAWLSAVVQFKILRILPIIRDVFSTDSFSTACIKPWEDWGLRVRNLKKKEPLLIRHISSLLQCSCSGWPTGNGKRLKSSQAQLGQATCLAVA